MADAHPRQRERHHPPVGSTLRRKRADRAGYRVKGARLQPGSSPAATVQPPTSSTGATAEETRPHHGTPRTTTTVNERPACQPSGRADSGKHKTTGMNVQVACTLDGRLAWISDAVSGNRHDTYCPSESGVLLTLDPGNWIGDKGYVGNDMITPIKKPACRDLLDWEKEFNNQVNKIRYVIEQVIANFKTWRVMHTDYRRPLATFATTISTVIALHFYAAS